MSRAGFASVLSGLILTLGLTATLAVTIGPVPLPPHVVWGVAVDHIFHGLATHDWQGFQANIVWEIRLPRVLLGGLVGAGLAIVGGVMQALVRNPLADPYLLGVSSGAGLGAVSVLLLGFTSFGMYSCSVAAFGGALLASACVYLVTAHSGSFGATRLILGGVAVSYLFSALTDFFIYRAAAGEQAKSILFWLLGSLGGARWGQLAAPAVILGAGFVALMLQARALNVLSTGEEGAITLGVDPTRVRKLGVVLIALMTGAVVALSGGIGFVGLIVPHVARIWVGGDHRRMLPVAALVGATFLIWADVLARTIIAPQELPIGILTALVGTPSFLWLMRRSWRREETGP